MKAMRTPMMETIVGRARRQGVAVGEAIPRALGRDATAAELEAAWNEWVTQEYVAEGRARVMAWGYKNWATAAA